MTYEEDLHLEATELRLGLPGRTNNESADQKQLASSSSSPSSSCASRGIKRTSSSSSNFHTSDSNSLQSQHASCPSPPPKAQIVGWPPIRSCRKNSIQVSKHNDSDIGSGVYVKVSMDGAPYLRKIDLNMYKGYTDLLKALGGMFKCNNINTTHHQYATTYEDKEGDWMLAGDVPWEMFLSSCKRLRIMRSASQPKPHLIIPSNLIITKPM